MLVDVRVELEDKPALAHPRLAHDRHELHRVIAKGTLEQTLQQRLLHLAADHWNGMAAKVRAETRTGSDSTPNRERPALPFHAHRLEGLVVEDIACSEIGRLPDRDSPRRRNGLEPSSGVDDVAGHHPLALGRTGAEGDDDLARVDPDPHRELKPLLQVQLVNRLQDPQAGADGPLGVVLMDDGGTEDRHHRVADELLHRAAVALDLPAQARVVRPHGRADVLGIGGLRAGCKPDQIAEEDGHELPLFARPRGSLPDGRTAFETEFCSLRVLLAAARTRGHRAESRLGPATGEAPRTRLLMVTGSLRADEHQPELRRSGGVKG